MELDYLIVGGGIHGVHIAARLIGEGGVEARRIRILDPAPTLLARWRACTARTGMTYLRSPSVHHLDLHPWSLQRFAGERSTRRAGLFTPPYDRPSLKLFDAHCDVVVDRYGIAPLHVQARAARCSLVEGGVRVETEAGARYDARKLVLAIGASEQPCWPDWAPEQSARIKHIFAPGGTLTADSKEQIAIIGGGISAGQIALRLASEGYRVHLVSRHALREHQFDSDPGWLGPKFMRGFNLEPALERRREMITRARHRGSVPADVQRPLRLMIEQGRVMHYEREIASARERSDGVELVFTDNTRQQVDRVILATGFSTARPGGQMIDALIKSASLPLAPCGYPVVDEMCRWHPDIYVTGPLAELALGPASRNIAGARRAGDSIIAALDAELAAA